MKLTGERFFRLRTAFLFCVLAVTLGASALSAHHFKGLPHYNYFENYPQVPEEEFLGQAQDYEFSLVVYDFQGINRRQIEEPDNVRLFLVIFNLRNNTVYNGPATLEILDRGEVVAASHADSAELENLYSLRRILPDDGAYSLRITLHGENDLTCVIPFRLSSQVIQWDRWVALVTAALVAIAAVGARKKRVAMDRKAVAEKRAKQKWQEVKAR